MPPPQELRRRQSGVVSRRDFLKGLGLAATAGVAVGFGAGELLREKPTAAKPTPIVRPTTIPVQTGPRNLIERLLARVEQQGKGDFVYAGSIRVKVFNPDNVPIAVRTAPEKNYNRIPWQDIVELNGVNMDGVTEFSITNPLIVKEPEGFNPATYQDGPWIKLSGTVRGSRGEELKKDLYVNAGPTNLEYIREVYGSKIVPLERKGDGTPIIKTKLGTTELQEIGRITVLASK